jgi:uncharacterized peroxidase-related enzyme
MSRISIPTNLETAPVASRPLLEGVHKQLGVVPNMFKLIAVSPIALEASLALSATLGKGTIAPPTRERIALAVSEINGCLYCLSAHQYVGKNLAKLDDAELSANRAGSSNEPKAAAAVQFAAKVARERGHVSDGDIRALKAAGYDEAQLIEIVLRIALHTFTNYLNVIAETEIDFPVALPLASSPAP